MICLLYNTDLLALQHLPVPAPPPARPGVGRPPLLAHLPSLGPRAILSETRFSGPARGEAELTR